MDIQELGILIGIAKNIPDTAAQRAEAAASVAAEAAILAEQHSYGVSVEGTTLTFTKEDEE